MTNLTLLNEQEIFLRDFNKNYVPLPRGPQQLDLMEKILDLGLYRKLAQVVLEQDENQQNFVFTEKGALTQSLNDRLSYQIEDRLRLLLQAIKSFSVCGMSGTELTMRERNAILSKIREESEFVDGVEVVYQALLQR